MKQRFETEPSDEGERDWRDSVDKVVKAVEDRMWKKDMESYTGGEERAVRDLLAFLETLTGDLEDMFPGKDGSFRMAYRLLVEELIEHLRCLHGDDM